MTGETFETLLICAAVAGIFFILWLNNRGRRPRKDNNVSGDGGGGDSPGSGKADNGHADGGGDGGSSGGGDGGGGGGD